MVYRDMIERICTELGQRYNSLEQELSTLPEGEFYSRSKDGVPYYFRRLRKEGNRKKERRIGIKKDPGLLNALVRKKYVTEALSILAEDIKEAEHLLKVYTPSDENSVMGSFTIRYPELAGGIYHGTLDPQEWARSGGNESDFHKESLTSTAADGTMRRSKGELLIGAKLDQYRIPYIYEATAHPDLPWVPDFKILRPRDHKIFFWEHFGMVNNSEYMDHCRRKLADYESAGIVPWDNLIITYDQPDGGINEKLIDAMIHGWLL